MNVTKETGLLPIFAWLVGRDFFSTWLRCLAVTPGGVFLVGLIFEGRIVPISPKKQYLSFMPGDLFLSTFCALLLVMPVKVDIPQGIWYTSLWWQTLALLICLTGAIAVHFLLESKVYRPRSLNSPTKLYHDIALYGLYNYVMWGVGLPKLLSGNLAGVKIFVFLPLLSWLTLVIIESSLTNERLAEKREFAHPSDWRFPWK